MLNTLLPQDAHHLSSLMTYDGDFIILRLIYHSFLLFDFILLL